MKKSILPILLFLLVHSFVIGQQEFKNLVGSYSGVLFENEELQKNRKIFIEIDNDYCIRLREEFDGLKFEHFNKATSPFLGKPLSNSYHYSFIPLADEHKNETLKLVVYDAPISHDTDYDIILFLFKDQKIRSTYTLVKDQGKINNPTKIIQTQDLHKTDLFTGETDPQFLGNYKVDWIEKLGIGALQYAHLVNSFDIRKSQDKYIVSSSPNKSIHLEFKEENNQYQLNDILAGKSFLDNQKIKKYSNQILANNEQEFIKSLGTIIHDLFQSKYVIRDQYTMTFDNKSNGKGIFIFTEKEGETMIVYSDFKDSYQHGQSIAISSKTFKKGNFVHGKREGRHIQNIEGEYRSYGNFVNNKKDGIWRYTLEDNRIYEVVMKDGEKISQSDNLNVQIIPELKEHVNNIKTSLEQLDKNASNISNIIDQCESQKSNIGCLSPTLQYLNSMNDDALNAHDEMEKASVIAEENGCTQFKNSLDKGSKRLWTCKTQLRSAYENLSQAIRYPNSATASKDFENGRKKYSDAINSYTKCLNIWNLEIVKESCFMEK